jgi:hypothetical protein
LGDLREANTLKGLDVNGRIIFKWIFEKWDEEYGLWLREGEVVSSCECGYEHSGSINTGNFLTSQGPLNFSERTLLRGIC